MLYIFHQSNTSLFSGYYLFKSTQKKYECVRCNKFYKTPKTLNQHLRVECGKEKKFHCIYCPHRCYYKRDLMLHMNTKHFKSK